MSNRFARGFAMPWVTIGSAGAVIAGLLAAPGVAAASATPDVTYSRLAVAPAAPAGSRPLGASDTSARITGAVALAPRDPSALAAAASAVSNPRSQGYHDFLAKGTFASTFGPTAATIDAVKSTLAASHLTVTSVSGNGLLVHFSGTVAATESAFRTKLSDFRLANGQVKRAPTTAVSFPATIAPDVAGILGLSNASHPTSTVVRPSHPAARPAVTAKLTHYTGAPDACAAASAAAKRFGGLTDDQIAHAYGVDGLYKAGDTGLGQTIGLFELEPFQASDLRAFDTCYFGPSKATTMMSRVHTVGVDGGSGVGPGSGESILDLDDLAGLAPGASINVYEAPQTDVGALDEYIKMIQDDPTVISTSWGECETDLLSSEPGAADVENTIFEQAALQGESIFAASGDAGAEDCARTAAPSTDPLAVDDPASQPFVTAVGGTSITNANNPPSEQIWNDGSDGGAGGGGVSRIWGAQSWQQPFLDTSSAAAAVSNASLTTCGESITAALCREVPDVSAQADELTGAITSYQASFGGWGTVGGTSSATPIWAALTADINATTGCSGSPVGFVSPALYTIASTPAMYAASFNDVKVGNNDVYDVGDRADFAAKSGYDMASGLGTPKLTSASGGVGLAAHLCALAAPGASRPTITNVAPAAIDSSTTGSLTITGTGLAGAKSVSVGNDDVSDGDWTAAPSGTSITISPIPSALEAGNGAQPDAPQDGSGRAIVSVTGSTGVSTAITTRSLVTYVPDTASPVPTVAGVVATGGPEVGGNKITVFGSGFVSTPASSTVTVGGVAATNVTVLTPDKLTATVPAYDGATSECAVGNDPATDVCQAQVVVSNGGHDSATATIRPPRTGAPFEGTSDGTPVPDCVTADDCELLPAISEYDYFPTPKITSVTTTQAGDSTAWVSEQGTTIATIDGTGFDPFSVDWVDVGPATDPDSFDMKLLDVTPNEVQVIIPGRRATAEPVTRNLAIQSIVGLSPAKHVRYAGVPDVSRLSPHAGPDTGGTSVTVTGKGFQGVAPADGGELSFDFAAADASTDLHSGYHAVSDTSLKAVTPATAPGAFFVSVCTITFCSLPDSERSYQESTFEFFEPGNPVVTGLSVHKGPASGGTRVIITGQNLSDAVRVTFGSRIARATSAPAILTNGSNTEINAIVPPGAAGTKVNVVVETVESDVQGKPSAKTSADMFTYISSAASPPVDVKAVDHHSTVDVTWKKPLSNGGHAITTYRVSAVSLSNSGRPGAKKPPTVTLLTKHSTTRSATLSGLRGGWIYEVRVIAITSKGRGLAATAGRYFVVDSP